MYNVRLFQDETANINLEGIAEHLNFLCKYETFLVGKTKVIIPDAIIQSPETYAKLGEDIFAETKDDYLAIIITRKPHADDFFYATDENIAILSFYSWENLTRLPLSNGLVYLIADFLAAEIDNTYRHHYNDDEPKPDCIFDYGLNKEGIDIGMRSAMICPDCMQRIRKSDMTPAQMEIFDDLRVILNDLGNASKWDIEIIEYWEAKRREREHPDPKTNIRNQVFISYSHADVEWLRRLKIHLKPFERNHQIAVWDDTKLTPGSDWRQEIKQALEKTKIAVLMVSANFLASDFIATDELPPLLAAAEKEGAVIIPILLKPCSFTRFANLSRFQAVNPPSQTLVEMNEGEQERFLLRLTEDILNELG